MKVNNLDFMQVAKRVGNLEGSHSEPFQTRFPVVLIPATSDLTEPQWNLREPPSPLMVGSMTQTLPSDPQGGDASLAPPLNEQNQKKLCKHDIGENKLFKLKTKL